MVTIGAPRIALTDRRLCRLVGDTVQAHGFRLLCGGRNPSGADGVLLRQAQRLRRRGIEGVLGASNDHTFATFVPQLYLHRQEIATQARAALEERDQAESPLSRFYPRF